MEKELRRSKYPRVILLLSDNVAASGENRLLGFCCWKGINFFRHLKHKHVTSAGIINRGRGETDSFSHIFGEERLIFSFSIKKN